MTTRKQAFSIGEYYHLYNRGVDKRLIFLDTEDYKQFELLMYACNTTRSFELRRLDDNFNRGETLVDVGSYCLMPNHFHLLVHEKSDYGISKYMLKITTSYSMYFNKKYTRTGTLWEGTFKSTHISKDSYLKYIYSYIHLNPAKLIDPNWKESNDNSKLLKYISNYNYSSLKEYASRKFRITNPKPFPNYFQTFSDHEAELISWLNFNK